MIIKLNFRVPEDEWTIIDDYYDDYVSEDEMEDYSTKPVPIWLSICLVIGYIVGGAFLFQVRIFGTFKNSRTVFGTLFFCPRGREILHAVIGLFEQLVSKLVSFRNGKDGPC